MAYSLARHLESRERGFEPRSTRTKKKRKSEKQPLQVHRPSLRIKQHAIFLAEHEKQHQTGRFACTCGLKYVHAICADKHATNECKVENPAQIHVLPKMKVTCPEERYGH